MLLTVYDFRFECWVVTFFFYVIGLTASFSFFFFSWFFWLLLTFGNCWVDSFKSKGYDPFKDLLCFLHFSLWMKETLTIFLFPINGQLVFLLSLMHIFVSGKKIWYFPIKVYLWMLFRLFVFMLENSISINILHFFVFIFVIFYSNQVMP